MNCYQDKVLEKAVFGFACCRIILSDDGNPVDYEIVETNSAYKKLCGIKEAHIEGKKISEIKPTIHYANSKEWLSLFGDVALNEGEKETEYYYEALNKWFRVQVFSEEQYYFTVVLHDITHEKHLIQSAEDFINSDKIQADYRKMCDDLRAMTGAKYAAFNISNLSDNGFTTMALSGIRNDILKAGKLLGFELEGKSWPHDPDRFEKISGRTITHFDSVGDLAENTFSSNFSKTLENTFGLGEVVLVTIKKSGKMLGDFTLIMAPGDAFKNENLVEIFARQTALVLEYYHSKQVISHFFEVSPDLMLVVNKYGNLLRVNDAWEQTLGFSIESLIGRKFIEYVHPGDVASTEIAFSDLITKGTILGFVNRYKTINNSYRYLEWRARSQGELIYGAARDITEKRQAEQELKEKADLQKTLMQVALKNINLPIANAEDAINHSLGQLAQFAHADRAYIFDYLWDEQITKNTFEWCAPDVTPQIQNLQEVPLSLVPEWVSTHKKGEIMYVADVKALAPDSGIRQVLEPQHIKSLITIPMMEDGHCMGFVGFDWVKEHHEHKESQQLLLELFAQMLVNMRVRARMEQALVDAKENAEKADKLKTAFLNNISHELRTPLNGIMGFAELLCQPENTEEETSEYIRLMEKNTNRLLKTMHDYMDISALTSGNMTVSEKPVSIHKLFSKLESEFNDRVAKSDISVNAEIPQEDSYILTDEDMLQKIFIQLIDNAIKFTPQGSVTYGCELEKSHFKGFVKDTGVGVPEEMQDKVFNYFIQEDSSNTRRFEGSGLGLSIVEGIIGMLGGEISLKSKKGTGTTVTFSMPVTYSKPSDDEDPQEVYQGDDPLVLIAEDDASHQIYLRQILKKKHLKTMPVNTGSEAVKVCKDLSDVKLVLMDIKMPGMSGLEATRQIKQNRPDLTVIAITAYAMHGDEQAAREAGCDEYLTKPIQKKKLYQKLKAYGILKQ